MTNRRDFEGMRHRTVGRTIRRVGPGRRARAANPIGLLAGNVGGGLLARTVLTCAMSLATGHLAADETAHAGERSTARGDRRVAEYFEAETKALEGRVFEGIETKQDWEAAREGYRRQLAEMLGLDPMPERTPLHATVVGTLDSPSRAPAADGRIDAGPGFVVERLHFQPAPGLYVAANLYRPETVAEPVPAVLYVCGHANVVEDGVRMGNKTAYQHHGAWFARHGYVCMIIDTVQRGEFEGIHHGTYRYGMWWWNDRGYTPAGVEAWTGIRAIDYLQSRPEVDPDRIGITGRSGGGVYSWWVAALDDRVTAAVPVAGITTLRNHVVDGCVEGHCDCMYMVNTYRWDYPIVAALVAPRPLLISNSDKDGIFPLDGVVALHAKVRQIYRLYDAEDRLGLQITEGPHKDTQELRVHAFRWMNRFLRDDDSLIRVPAEKFFSPQELKVFDALPEDERVTSIHESFVAAVDPEQLPESRDELSRASAAWEAELREKTFGGWPGDDATSPSASKPVAEVTRKGVRVSVREFDGQVPYRLPFYVIRPDQPGNDDATENRGKLRVTVLDQHAWDSVAGGLRAAFDDNDSSHNGSGNRDSDDGVHDSLDGILPDPDRFETLAKEVRDSGTTAVLFAPRGVGPTEWSRDERERTHLRRRFMLLGQTADGMRVWDVRQLLRVLDNTEPLAARIRVLAAARDAASWVLHASLFGPAIDELELTELATRNRDGISLLNVSRIVEPPQLVLMAADRVNRVTITARPPQSAEWRRVASDGPFGDEQRIVVEELVVELPDR